MASKRRKRRKSCTGKKRYPSRKEAMDSRDRVFKEYRIRLDAYKCDFCGGWHIGHGSRGRRYRKREKR